jgi:dehydrogenase/reductase SDR family protein 4
MFDLTNKVALVTGSTKGIGRAIAFAMARAGARVVVSSRKAEACEAVARSLRAEGAQVLAIPCNVSDTQAIEAMVGQTLDTWGRVDSLVCNAAVNPYMGPLAGITDEAWTKTMDTNVRNVLRTAGLVMPQMADRRDGSIIVVSSIGGLKGHSALGAYAISKAADMQLVRNLACEWGPHNIRVNAIAPGLIKTDMAAALWQNPERARKATDSYPLGRLGEPDDIAGAAVFLASRAGAFMTGQTLVIDGGAMVNTGNYS